MSPRHSFMITLALGVFGSIAVASGASAAPLPIPVVTTGTASNILTGKVPSATLSGEVDPTGGEEITKCDVEIRGEQTLELYGVNWEQEQYQHNVDEHTVPCTPALPYLGPTDVTANVSGLQIGTAYEYNFVASNSSHTFYGGVKSFRIPGLPIVVFHPLPSTTQAGGHPNIRTKFIWANRETLAFPSDCDCQDARTVTNHLPAGVIGNPHSVPYCSTAQLGTFTCPPDSQVGTIWTLFRSGDFFSPLYNIEPDPDQAGLLGFEFPFTNSPAFLGLSARTGSDYGLDATLSNVPQTVPPEGSIVTLWGVPADPSHDAYRVAFGFHCGDEASGEPPLEEGTRPPCQGAPPTPSTSPRIPFLENPTTCGEALTPELEVLAYDTGISFADSPYPATTGCDQLSFNPSLSAQPTTTATDTPSGLEVNLSVPQQQSPEVPSPSEIRAASIKLPKGFSINTGAADGKSACADVEARLGTPKEAQCPETSKVGTVTLNSSALPGPIPGFVYLLEPKAGDRYRILLSANGFATHVKVVGSVTPDPTTGQLTTSFPNLPESPFTDFNIHYFGSERGLLATPTQCGTYPVESSFTPWDSALPEQTSTQLFTLSSGPGGAPCPGSSRPFNPAFQASSVNSTAAAHSPFSLEVTRSDGDQNLSSINVTTPPGFSATLKGIPYCSEVALADAAAPSYSGLQQQSNPSCPPASQIGTATVGAGAGSHPVYLSGQVYLAGPYKGAPLSLAVITPAVSGPYDLGSVVVRAAINVNPETAQITAVSDSLPQIFEGIPLRLRSVLVNLNRPNFTLNPTNCDPLAVNTQIFGSEGVVASPSEHFQAANCRTLPFAPKLNLKLTGGVHRRGHPAIQATLQTNPGEANPSSVSVTLPSGELLDNAHIGTVCTKPQFAQNACPAGSLVGDAEVATPLLDQPLTGPVYLRSSSHGLPDLAIDLHGQIPITVIGQVSSVDAGLRTTFPTIPDVPVGRFTVNFLGGNKGLVQNSETLCGARKKATVQMAGQNGRTSSQRSELQVSCGKGSEARRAHRAHNKRKALR